MKTSLLIFSFLTVSFLGYKKIAGTEPKPSRVVVAPEDTQKNAVQFNWMMQIKPLGFDPRVPYAAPYIDYLNGARKSNKGC